MIKIDDTKQYEKLQKLRDEGNVVWSISRLNNYNNCPHGYYLTYMAEDRDRGIQNIYSHAGTIVHDTLEELHINRELDEQEVLKSAMNQIQMDKMFDSDLQFPKSNGANPNKIEENWTNAMNQFCDHFSRLPNHVETEKLFVYEIMPNVYIQGYIDAITTDNKGNLLVLDWKTSSRFTGQKKVEAGRQLVLYKMAVEQVFGMKVDKVGWYMLKYGRAYYGGRSKMVDRGKWVEEISKQLDDLLVEYVPNELTRTFMLQESIKNNNIDNLPQEVKDIVRLEPLIEYYKVTPELEQELMDYIKNTINNIDNDFMFNPNVIDYSNSFFCANLCGQRRKCSAFAKWERQQEEKKQYE